MALKVQRGAAKKYLWSPNGKNWYVRRKGVCTPIGAAPGTPDFDARYWAILLGGGAVPKTSWRALWLAYTQGPWWRELKPRTQKDYRKCAEYLLDLNGDQDMRQARRADVVAAMDANQHRPRFANYLRTFMGVLFSYAQHIGWREDNPARGIRSLKTPDAQKAEHIPWTDDAVAKWRAEASPAHRLIFEVGVGSVQRPSDWLQFTWGDYDGKALRIVQGKTDAALYLPCTPALKAALDAAKPEGAIEAMPILRGRGGGRMTYDAMAQFMLRERRRLGLERFDLHAMRYRGVMELAWAGCDDDEIMSFSGHATKAMVRKYAGQARQIMRARSAAKKRANKGGAKKEPDKKTDKALTR